MAEMILPGTYIEVRAEGLIRPGSVSVGNIGIVGTASRGELNKVYTPANIGDARDIFGEPDAYPSPGGRELTLVRALELAFANGAQRVFATRVYPENEETQTAKATFNFKCVENDQAAIPIKAIAAGSDYNTATLETAAASVDLCVSVSQNGGIIKEFTGLPTKSSDFVQKLTEKDRDVPEDKIFSGISSENSDFKVSTDLAFSSPEEKPAVYLLGPQDSGGIKFTAKTPGPGMNDLAIQITETPPGNNNYEVSISGETHIGNLPGTVDEFVRLFNQASNLFDVANVGINSNETIGTLIANPLEQIERGVFIFRAEHPENSASIQLETEKPDANNWSIAIHTGSLNVTFQIGRLSENWRNVPTRAKDFIDVINGESITYNYLIDSSTRASNLFRFAQDSANGNENLHIKPGEALKAIDGEDGSEADNSAYKQGLNALLNQDVHIIVLAGEGVTAGRDMKTVLVAHLETASDDLMRRERIGIIGCDKYSNPTDLETPDQLDGRLLFVGPGIQAYDAASNRVVTLPGTYTAAAVAGKLSALAPHESLTNKPINVMGLEKEFNGTELEQLLQNRVLALESRNGATRVVRGITSSTNTAWKQITTRRIVDYAKFGVRAAANPFIGKLNNARVRAAMKGSVNSFLADMVDREMLISYELDVSATRDQEIRGIAQIILVLHPTFSIDFIRVVMYLG
jgi:hypothetical protein